MQMMVISEVRPFLLLPRLVLMGVIPDIASKHACCMHHMLPYSCPMCPIPVSQYAEEAMPCARQAATLALL